MNNKNNNLFPFAASTISGLIVCLIISAVTKEREAWDSSSYYTIGIPVMCVLIFIISYRFPNRAGLWTVAMALGQMVGMLFSVGSFSPQMGPLTLIPIIVLSLPQFVSALIASWLVKNKSG